MVAELLVILGPIWLHASRPRVSQEPWPSARSSLARYWVTQEKFTPSFAPAPDIALDGNGNAVITPRRESIPAVGASKSRLCDLYIVRPGSEGAPNTHFGVCNLFWMQQAYPLAAAIVCRRNPLQL